MPTSADFIEGRLEAMTHICPNGPAFEGSAAFEGILILADIREAAFGRSSALTEPLGRQLEGFRARATTSRSMY